MDVFFYPNGSTAVFNTKGEQIPELQKPYIVVFAEFLERDYGIDPLKLKFKMPDGKKAHIFSTAHGYSWRFK